MPESLPYYYSWLNKETAPRILVEARAQYGVLERPGIQNNPIIMAWAKEVGTDVHAIYNADSVPWCGLFMAVCAKRAKLPLPAKPLWALNWSKFGKAAAPIPMLGDVLTFRRAEGGHVGLYVGEDEGAFHVLGGNQSDRVCITRIKKDRLYAARRTDWQVGQPANVRRVVLSPLGEISTNEA